MIVLGTKEIDPLFIGGKKIKKVYFGSNLVYPSFPKFTTIEMNGENGTYDGWSYIYKGRYRVILVGGGGSTGRAWRCDRHGKKNYYTSYSGAGGACVYCIINIPYNGNLGYKVGGRDSESVLRVYRTGKYDMTIVTDKGENGYATGGGNHDRVRYGGNIYTRGDTNLIESSAIWSNGNNGNGVGCQKYASRALAGALSVCKGGGVGYPYIDLQWGRGASIGSFCDKTVHFTGNGSKPGYFKIERIG